MQPKVSIIIPVYNVEKYLEECMESAVQQTLREIEIICINDGSTDRSPEILERYAAADPRIRLISKKNEGYGVGMNIGLENASGEYIGILEPDDFVPAEMYETLYRTAHEKDLDLIKADFFRFVSAPDGTYIKTLNRLSADPDDYGKIFDPGNTPSALAFIMNTWSGIYKRSFIEQYRIRHNTTPGAAFQDTGFWAQTFIYAHRAMIIDTPLYMNRRDNAGSSVHDPKKVYTINREFDFVRSILERDEKVWERFRGMYWRCKYQGYTARLQVIAPKYRAGFVRQMGSEFRAGLENGEIDLSLFNAGEQKWIRMVAKDPIQFLFLYEASLLKYRLRTRMTGSRG